MRAARNICVCIVYTVNHHACHYLIVLRRLFFYVEVRGFVLLNKSKAIETAVKTEMLLVKTLNIIFVKKPTRWFSGERYHYRCWMIGVQFPGWSYRAHRP